MPAYSLAQWPILVVVVLVLMIVGWLLQRQNAAVSAQMKAQMDGAKELLAMVAPQTASPPRGGANGAASPEATGGHQAQACVSGCRAEVLEEVAGLREDVTEWRRDQGERLAAIETDVRWLARGKDTGA